MTKRLFCSLFAATIAATAGTADAATLDSSVYGLAGKCMSVDGSAHRFQATGLGTFVLYDGDVATIGPATEYTVRHVKGAQFTLKNTESGKTQTATLSAASGCATFPEADVDVTGRPASTRGSGNTVRGIVDAHLHVTGSMRAGGAVFGGTVFDRFGITRALGNDAEVHGDDGSNDVTGNLLRDGVPFGTHDTGGWPTFKGWPTNATDTHEQIYWKWLERAWRGGLRLVVAQTVEDAPLCKVEPVHKYSCDETRAIRGQIDRLRRLQNYIDAQFGGPGKGWFRIVESPSEARTVIRSGKLAVVIGIESSDLLDCSEAPGIRACTARQVDQRIAAYRKLGVRSMFVAHWVDNQFSGAAAEGGVKGKFINALQRIDIGNYMRAGKCPSKSQGEVFQAPAQFEIDVLSDFFPAVKVLDGQPAPKYPTTKQCNRRGLTSLGRHLIDQMMRTGTLIEVDHMSEKARDTVLKITGKADYPVVSSHTDTGGLWTSGEVKQLKRAGGVTSNHLGDPATMAKAIVARPGGLGSDTNGFANLPGKASLTYPFKLNGQTFDREVTGERTFDLNTDGMAHYGLLPDLLAAMAKEPKGARALKILNGSAEAYLRMWETADKAASR
jgi:microsomal dipeptidase-like Zn-dependent dipeptidase